MSSNPSHCYIKISNFVSSNSVHGEVYSIQHYMIRFVSDLIATGEWFSPCTPVSPTNKTDRHDIAEILLKMPLNTIKPKLQTPKGIMNKLEIRSLI